MVNPPVDSETHSMNTLRFFVKCGFRNLNAARLALLVGLGGGDVGEEGEGGVDVRV
jgi:hypothetical protein